MLKWGFNLICISLIMFYTDNWPLIVLSCANSEFMYLDIFLN